LFFANASLVMKKQDSVQQIVEAIDRQNVLLEQLPESIGKTVAKWLIKADLPTARQELREIVYLELGFLPTEIVDLLYPNLGKAARRTKAQAISLRGKN